MRKSLVLFVFAACFFIPNAVFASPQAVTTGALSGIVLESEQASLAGASIMAVHEPTNTSYRTTTRTDGRYDIINVLVGGPYRIEATLAGFKTGVTRGIQIKLGETQKVDFVLFQAVVDAGEMVVRAGSDPVINSGRTGAGQNVTSRMLESLPTIGRDLSDFIKLAPQVDINPEAPGSFSVVGKNNRYNNIQIDGAVNNDLFGLAASGTPGGQAEANMISLDAIHEFQVLVSPYDVRHGGFTGGVINAVTKSGANEFFGSFFSCGRNQDFVGKGFQDVAYPIFNESRTGLSFGGPVVKDKLFFFLSGELVQKNTPDQWIIDDSGTVNDWGGTNVSLTEAERFVSILDGYGYKNPTGVDKFIRDTDSGKLFARFDFNLSSNNRLTLRHNYVKGLNDLFFGRSATQFGLSDTGYIMRNTTNSTVLQLTSALSSNLSNELILNVSSIRDRRAGDFEPFPEVTVTAVGSYSFKAGTEQYSTKNELDQDIIEITDNLTLFTGSHAFTLGTHNEFFKFRNLFIPAAFGAYSFNSLDDFAAGRPSYYKYTYSNTGDPSQAARFKAMQLGLYASDRWAAHPNLVLTFGLRLDAPIIPEKPTANPKVEALFGIPTDQVPLTRIYLSPRMGINWDLQGDGRTQIRGGAGLFAGRTPYVWISNQFSNTGIEFTRIEARGANAPAFVSDPFAQPESGFAGATNEINVIDQDYRYPQVFRTSLGLDRRLPWDIVASLEVVYSKTINDVLYQDLNIAPTGEVLSDGRPLYGVPGKTGLPNYVTKDFTSVIHLTNASDGYQYHATVQLQRNTGALQANLSYTYGLAKDRNSGTSSQARSNWRYNPTDGDPNNPPLAFSVFDIRHRVKAALSYRLALIPRAPATLSLFYNAYSGAPYSTLYYGDANGDGQKNDLIYVPLNADDILLTSGNWDKLDAYIKGDPALEAARGSIIERNASREPWKHLLDFRLSQDIPIFGLKRGAIQVTLDILNLANLINKNWGKYEYMTFDDSPLTFQGIDAATGKPKLSFYEKASRFIVSDFLSRWSMQLGLRVNL